MESLESPWTVLHENPSIELKVSATNLAFSANDAKIADFWAVKLSYDGSPGLGGLTTTSMQAWPITMNHNQNESSVNVR